MYFAEMVGKFVAAKRASTLKSANWKPPSHCAGYLVRGDVSAQFHNIVART